MWIRTATDCIAGVGGRAHGATGRLGSLGETVSLSRPPARTLSGRATPPLGDIQVFPRETGMGGPESLTCWEIAPALISQGAVSSASDIYQTSFTRTCQCACGCLSRAVESSQKPRVSLETRRRGTLGVKGERRDRELGKNHEGGGGSASAQRMPVCFAIVAINAGK